MGEGYWDMVIESYCRDAVKEVIDNQYGPGASAYITGALQAYFRK